jgi:hypothetical protein
MSDDPRRPSMAVRIPRGIEPTEAALAATRFAGCTCDPHVEIKGRAITIKHDRRCAVLRKGGK